MSKIPLVLLPGLVSDQEVWAHQLAHLSDIADMVVPNLSNSPTPDAMVDAVLKVAPETFALAGHSMGGWVAAEVVKRCLPRIQKLCFIDTVLEADSPEKAADRRQLMHRVEQGEGEAIAEHLTKVSILNPAVYEQVKRMFVRNINALIPQEKAMLGHPECLSVLPSIQCPTLVIYAPQDKVFSRENSNNILRGIPQAKLALIEDSGHMVTMERPQAVTALMRFWLMYF